jgi:hypothetical protein
MLLTVLQKTIQQALSRKSACPTETGRHVDRDQHWAAGLHPSSPTQGRGKVSLSTNTNICQCFSLSTYPLLGCALSKSR